MKFFITEWCKQTYKFNNIHLSYGTERSTARHTIFNALFVYFVNIF